MRKQDFLLDPCDAGVVVNLQNLGAYGEGGWVGLKFINAYGCLRCARWVG